MKLIFILLFIISSLYSKNVDINFNNLDINDFIKMVSKITNKNILVTYPIKGKIDFISSKKLDSNNLLKILNSVLETKGYTTTEGNNGFLKIVRKADALRENLPLNPDENSPLMSTEVIKLSHINASGIVAKLRPYISKYAKIDTLTKENVLIISDYKTNISTIKKIIAKVDIKQIKVVKFIQIFFADINAIQKEISTISSSLFNVKILMKQ